MHVEGGGWSCSGGSGGISYSGYSRSDESCCFLTNCPECDGEVYFIRHNGGSVWIDPPLGWPWYKHPCMDTSYASPTQLRSTLVSGAKLDLCKSQPELVMGIVREAEVSLSKRCSLINIEIAADQNLILLMKNSAGFLVGRLVIYEPTKQSVSWFENKTYTFRVVTRMLRQMDETEITCPECQGMTRFSKLPQHLKLAHWFPQRPHWMI